MTHIETTIRWTQKIALIMFTMIICFLLTPFQSFAQTSSAVQQTATGSQFSLMSPLPAITPAGIAMNAAYSVAAVCSDPSLSICQKAEKGCNPPSSMSKETSEFINKILAFIIIVEKLLFVLNIPVIVIIGKLLSNDWVYLDNQVAGVLQNLWMLVRNIINIGFIPILIFAAVSSVVGAGEEKKKFAIGALLPKMIPALIIVNFSFLASKIILDVGNMATTASFSIVNEVGPGLLGQNDKEWAQSLFCRYKEYDKDNKPIESSKTCLQKNFYLYLGGVNQGGTTESAVTSMCKNNDIKDKSSITATDDVGFAFGGGDITSLTGGLYNARNAMFIYTYNVFRLPDVMKVFEGEAPNISTLSGVVLNVIYSIIYCALILLTNIALLIAFATRMVMIWLLLIFSPIMAVEMVFPDKKGKIPFMKGGFIHTIVSLAFMPALCGFILSIGILFYRIISESPIVKNGLTIPLWPFNINIMGSWTPQFSNIMQMALSLIMLIVIWKAIGAALKTNEYVDKAASGIMKFVDSGGKLIKEGLRSIPILPIPGKKALPIGSAAEVLPRLTSQVKQVSTEKGLSDLGKAFPDMFGFLDRGQLSAEDKQWIESLNNKTNDEQSNKKILEYLYEKGIDQGTPDDRRKIRVYLEKSLKDKGVKTDDPKLKDALQAFEEGTRSTDHLETIRKTIKDASLTGIGNDNRLNGQIPTSKTDIGNKDTSSETKPVTVNATGQDTMTITVGDKSVDSVGITATDVKNLKLEATDANKEKIQKAEAAIKKALSDKKIDQEQIPEVIEKLKTLSQGELTQLETGKAPE